MATMRLSADFSDLAAIREFVAQTGHDLGLDEDLIPDLQLAVDEICANVIEHGYNGQCGEIEITIEPIPNGVRTQVRDWGVAFEPQQVPTPNVTSPLEQRPLGGLGLFLVRQMMDDLRFEFDAQNGNTVTMVKRFRSREGKG
jgi:anti-sigma regulatory factor (Ser/Thr protein kinase)